jgi:hypothetical protein
VEDPVVSPVREPLLGALAVEVIELVAVLEICGERVALPLPVAQLDVLRGDTLIEVRALREEEGDGAGVSEFLPNTTLT